MLNCWGAVWWRAEFTGNNSRGTWEEEPRQEWAIVCCKGLCTLRGVFSCLWSSPSEARCQNHWESFGGARAPQKDSIWSTWGLHCPPGHLGTCCWPPGKLSGNSELPGAGSVRTIGFPTGHSAQHQLYVAA